MSPSMAHNSHRSRLIVFVRQRSKEEKWRSEVEDAEEKRKQWRGEGREKGQKPNVFSKRLPKDISGAQ